jgi:hypothetical protein
LIVFEKEKELKLMWTKVDRNLDTKKNLNGRSDEVESIARKMNRIFCS